MLGKVFITSGACVLWVTSALALQPLAPDGSVALIRMPQSAPDQTREEQLRAVTEQLGYRVMDPERADLVLGDAGRCVDVQGCDPADLRRRLGVDAVVLFEISATQEGKQMHVRVGHGKDEQEATAVLKDGAATAALQRLMARLLGGSVADSEPATTVLVTTVPPHGLVQVDRQVAQEAPASFQVPPGPHRIRGHLAGYSSVVENVDIPAQEAPFDYQLTLPQTSAASAIPVATAAPGDQQHQQPSAWNLVLAAGLGAATAGLVTYAVIEAGRDGKCVDESALGRCIEENDTEVAVLGAAIGASISGLAAAGLLLFKPLQVSVGPSDLGVGVTTAF